MDDTPESSKPGSAKRALERVSALLILKHDQNQMKVAREERGCSLEYVVFLRR